MCLLSAALFSQLPIYKGQHDTVANKYVWVSVLYIVSSSARGCSHLELSFTMWHIMLVTCLYELWHQARLLPRGDALKRCA